MRGAALLAVLLGAAPLAALADEEAPEPPDLPDLPPLPDLPSQPGVRGLERPEVHLSGFAAFDFHQYLLGVGDEAPPGTDATPSVTMIRLSPRVEARYRFIRARVEVELRHDFNDPGRGGRLIVREATVGLQTHGLRVEGGALLEPWGKMDVNSPTNTLVSQDYEELFFPEALPVPGFLVAFARGPFSVEGIFVPAFVPARFRVNAPSRWDTTWTLPQGQSVPTPFGNLDFTNNYAAFEPSVVPGEDLTRGFEGGIRADLFLPSVDVGLSFSAPHDRLPTYTSFRVMNTADTDGDTLGQHINDRRADLDITPYHRRLLVPGGDVAVTAGPLVFKGEAAYFQTEDAARTNCLIDDPYVKYAAGVELMLNNLVGEFDLAVRVQYNGDVSTASADDVARQEAACPGGQKITFADPASPLPTDYETGFQATPEIRHPFQHAIYWNVFLGFTPDFSLDLRGFVDTAGDALMTAKLAYTFAGAMEASLGTLVMLHTGPDTIFTPYRDNHRVEAGLLYRF